VSQSWQACRAAGDPLSGMTLGFYTASTPIRDQIDSQTLVTMPATEGRVRQSGCSILSSPLPIPGRTGRIFSGGTAQFAPTSPLAFGEKRMETSAPAASRAFRLPTYTGPLLQRSSELGNPSLNRVCLSFEGVRSGIQAGEISAN